MVRFDRLNCKLGLPFSFRVFIRVLIVLSFVTSLGFLPSTLTPSVSAPCRSKQSMISRWPPAAARWRGVLPFRSAALTLAPLVSRVWVTSTCPAFVARWRGVAPSPALEKSMCAPRRMSNRATSLWPVLSNDTLTNVECRHAMAPGNHFIIIRQ